uniref:Uncharacterized protein n=1 Tax=Gasterosteus aculeatus aculeatus TaxID=481459 RepID=A0AAQ4QBB1_GASAC
IADFSTMERERRHASVQRQSILLPRGRQAAHDSSEKFNQKHSCVSTSLSGMLRWWLGPGVCHGKRSFVQRPPTTLGHDTQRRFYS